MSRSFYIKNTEAPRVMSPNEILSLQPPTFIQYDVHDEEEHFLDVMNSPIDHYGSMLMGEEFVSGRGFEVCYQVELNSYQVRVFTPSTKADWQGAFEFIVNLARYLGVQVVDEEDTTYQADNITYDYLRDIEFGIRCYEGREGQYIFGVNYPMCLNGEMIDRLLSADDKATYFSEMVEAHQYVDAYFAKQRFYESSLDKNEGIIGVYALTEDLPTILPYEYPPFIDITKISLNQEDISQWRISLVTIEGDEDDPNSYKVMGDMDFKTFLERLPEEKIEKLDGHYMIVELSKSDMQDIIYQKSETSSLFGKIKNLFNNN
ncbi:DUF4299 family protein [Capnocytophaga canis]|uniref:DUF4299 domain-containing protein n=1 Tax=Capnocytophaga canis TaxID=1848903 RepID=A0A0B7I8S7_9FLAO|nr:DUF4299 family protein [Capnocytophaga canis]CEN48115.1 conserved hypothetical protein [Capnocytophaga canis]